MDFSKDGITTITDLNKHEDLHLHNDDKYWNPKLKEEFLKGFTNLWDKSYYEEGITRQAIQSESQSERA